ncbi:nicotinic acetylcholine receptor alpha subunit [Aphelenchoides avenae]|nr:nicotinic acetylcholine receptor alpha subunit [Aphelenchus avenae]
MSVWLKQVWLDKKLAWDPKNYGGVNVLYVPYEMIWVPDLVLYNNADGNYNITINTKATLTSSGIVTWEPPAIFKSLCQIDIRWFPFDEQQCHLKFGSWTYPEHLLNLQLLDGDARTEEIINEQGQPENITVVEDGIGRSIANRRIRLVVADLSDYYPSVEWDILSRVAKRRSREYPSCCADSGKFVEITFYLLVRRKPLFYTVNLVFPCVGISFLTILVFYLPSDSGEKVSLSVNILVALTMFFLLLSEIIPANGIILPFVGKYLLFTMIMVTLSVLITVVFLRWLPKTLGMRRPLDSSGVSLRQIDKRKGERILVNYHEHRVSRDLGRRPPVDERIQRLYNSPPVLKAFSNLCFIAELLKKKDRDDKVDEDWKYVAMVLDRLFLFIFTFVCFVGTGWILMQAPVFYDTRKPIDLQVQAA